MRVMRERVEAMRAIWTESKPQYDGETVKFGPMMTWPKPVQQPHPPVLIGGGIPHGARRALAYGDGWVPHARRPDYRLVERMGEYRAMANEAGRELPITAFGAEHEPSAWGEYRDHGIDRIVLSMDSEPADAVLPKLDAWARALDNLN